MADKKNPLDVCVEDEIVLRNDKKSYIVKDWHVGSSSMQFFVIRKSADKFELGMWVDSNKISKIVKKNND